MCLKLTCSKMWIWKNRIINLGITAEWRELQHKQKIWKVFCIFFWLKKLFFSFLLNYKMFLNILDKNEFIWVPKYFNHKERLEKFSDTRVFFSLSSSSFNVQMMRYHFLFLYFDAKTMRQLGMLKHLSNKNRIIELKISSFKVWFSKW